MPGHFLSAKTRKKDETLLAAVPHFMIEVPVSISNLKALTHGILAINNYTAVSARVYGL